MESLVSQRKGSSHAGDSTAYDHCIRDNSYCISSQRFEETRLCYRHLYNPNRFFRGFFLLSHMTPGTLFTNIGKIEQIFVQPCITNCLLEKRFVCPWSAGRYNHSIQIHFPDNVLEHCLAVL